MKKREVYRGGGRLRGREKEERGREVEGEVEGVGKERGWGDRGGVTVWSAVSVGSKL